MRRLMRRGFTLLEMLFAVVLMTIVFMAIMTLFRTGTRSVVVSTDHANARDNAMTILDAISRDLDKIIVGDSYDQLVFPNVVQPIMIDPSPQAGKFMFYCFHHRNFYHDEGRMELEGQLVEYKVRKRPGVDQGADVFRNDVQINIDPIEDMVVEKIDPDEAGQLGVSPFHAFRVIISPRGVWDTKNDKLARFNAQARLFHLKGIESQYACLLSLKESGAPYPILSLIPNPPARSAVYTQYNLDKVPMDWLRPLGLVTLLEQFYDEPTAGQNKEFGTPGSAPIVPPTPPPTGAPTECPFCTPLCGYPCDACEGTSRTCDTNGCSAPATTCDYPR